MSFRRWNSNGRRGVVMLATALTLTLIALIGAVLMAGTLIDQTRINTRRRDLWRAFLNAESGIAQVQQWGAFPDTFTPDSSIFVDVRDPDLDAAGLLLLTDAERFPELNTLGENGLLITESELDAMNVYLTAAGVDDETPYGAQLGFWTGSGDYLGKIRQIHILPIDDETDLANRPYDAADSPFVSTTTTDPNYAFFKVVCVGEAPLRPSKPLFRPVGYEDPEMERVVCAYMKPSPVAIIALGAPVISLATATANGNAKVHWGEAWSKTNFTLPPRSDMAYTAIGDSKYDPLAIMRTEAAFVFPSSWQWSTTNTSRLYTNFMSQAVGTTGRRPGLFPSGQGVYRNNYYQNVPVNTLDWPDFLQQYETFKKIAKANNRYYTTDASGNIYHNGTGPVDFYATFSPNDADTPFELAFVDTINQQPPAADGSNLASIHIQGQNTTGDRMRGFYYFNANFTVSGVGTPASLTVESPLTNLDTTLSKMWLDGVLYATGTVSMAGNAGVYGAVVAERGFAGTGTPDIYYNNDLADGLELNRGNIGGPFDLVLQMNYAPEGQPELVEAKFGP